MINLDLEYLGKSSVQILLENNLGILKCLEKKPNVMLFI